MQNNLFEATAPFIYVERLLTFLKIRFIQRGRISWPNRADDRAIGRLQQILLRRVSSLPHKAEGTYMHKVVNFVTRSIA